MSEDVTPQSLEQLRLLLQKYAIPLKEWTNASDDAPPPLETLWKQIQEGAMSLTVTHGQLYSEIHFLDLRVFYRDSMGESFQLVRCNDCSDDQESNRAPQRVFSVKLHRPDTASKKTVARLLSNVLGSAHDGGVDIDGIDSVSTMPPLSIEKTQVKKLAHMQKSEKSGLYKGLQRRRHCFSYDVTLVDKQYRELYVTSRGDGGEKDILYVWIAAQS